MNIIKILVGFFPFKILTNYIQNLGVSGIKLFVTELN